ncbi:MAG: UDP-glucose 4-epimerase GalE [Caulobacteraceae bacterium]
MTALLATGGAGYIGGQCVRELLDLGHEVVVYDNLSTGRRELVPSQAALVVGDVRDGERLRRTLVEHGIGAVLHFAGLISVPRSFERPLDYYQVNTGGMASLLEAAAGTTVRAVVFSSTAAVYAPRETPIDETAAVSPASPYGASKLMAERILQDGAAQAGVAYAILRYFNVAGADPLGRCGPVNAGAEDIFQRALACAAGEIDTLPIFGDDYPTPDGTGVRDFIHVKDLAALHVAALAWLERKAAGEGEVFNCGYGRGASVRQVVQAVGRAAGAPLATTTAPRRPGDLAQVVADSRKAAAAFDWRPRWPSVDAMAEHAWAWRRRSTVIGQA